jgi:hypothetical protein
MKPPTANEEQPLLERTFGRIIPELGDLSCHRDHRFLDHILRLIVGKPALPRDVVDVRLYASRPAKKRDN